MAIDRWPAPEPDEPGEAAAVKEALLTPAGFSAVINEMLDLADAGVVSEQIKSKRQLLFWTKRSVEIPCGNDDFDEIFLEERMTPGGKTWKSLHFRQELVADENFRFIEAEHFLVRGEMPVEVRKATYWQELSAEGLWKTVMSTEAKQMLDECREIDELDAVRIYEAYKHLKNTV